MKCYSTSNTCLCPFTRFYNSATYSCEQKSLDINSCSSNWTCREDLGCFVVLEYVLVLQQLNSGMQLILIVETIMFTVKLAVQQIRNVAEP
jgi:hypothetical protein